MMGFSGITGFLMPSTILRMGFEDRSAVAATLTVHGDASWAMMAIRESKKSTWDLPRGEDVLPRSACCYCEKFEFNFGGLMWGVFNGTVDPHGAVRRREDRGALQLVVPHCCDS